VVVVGKYVALVEGIAAVISSAVARMTEIVGRNDLSSQIRLDSVTIRACRTHQNYTMIYSGLSHRRRNFRWSTSITQHVHSCLLDETTTTNSSKAVHGTHWTQSLKSGPIEAIFGLFGKAEDAEKPACNRM